MRAVAVLFVVVSHINALLTWRTTNFDHLVNLYGGVDLFFCISGFVITSAFGKEIAESTADPRAYWRNVVAFYIRRAYRILPLSWVAFGGTLAVILIFQGTNTTILLKSFGDFLAIAFNVQNIHYGVCASAPGPYCGHFGVWWSLSLEEQFYLVFPLLFLLPRRLMILGLLAAFVIFALLPRTTMVWMTRIDAIALGVLLALARESHAYRAFEPTVLTTPRVRRTMAFILIAGLAVIPTGIVPFFPTMVSLISLSLVFIASYAKGYLFGAGTFRDALVWIGQRSFAIYLLHNGVFWLVTGLYAKLNIGPPTASQTVPFLIAAAVLLAVFSELSFRFLETPWRRKGKKVASDFSTGSNNSVEITVPNCTKAAKF